MTKDVQTIVDSLASRIRRSVALDDPHLRILAYSTEVGPVDAARTASILNRKPASKVVAWAYAQGIRTASGPVRLPANEDLQLASRVCVPVRAQGELLGFLWLIDADGSLSERDLALVQAAADASAAALQLERSMGELERSRGRELLRDLLSDQAAIRRHAAAEVVASELLVPTRAVAALVVQVAPSPSASGAPERAAIRSGIEQIRRGLSPRHALHLDRPDHGVLVLANEDPLLRVGGVEAVAGRLVELVRAKLRSTDADVVVGVGEPQADLADVVVSHEQARQATRVSAMIPAFSPVAVWSRLGVYRTLLQFPLDPLRPNILHGGLVALIRSDAGDDLLRTLEMFLDLGCSAQRTAAALELHRATLYYRLRRIEQIVGADLEDGNDRLALHLSFKLARLAGIIPRAANKPTADRRAKGAHFEPW